MKKTLVLTALIILVATLVGCSSQTEASREEEKQLREVVLTEYKIEPEVIKISSQKHVRFIVKNQGNFTHDFTVLTDPPEEVEVAPTSKDYLDVTISKPGDYEVVCKRHEASHMEAKLIVVEGDLSETESSSQPATEESVKEKPQTENPSAEEKPQEPQAEPEKQPAKKKTGPIFD